MRFDRLRIVGFKTFVDPTEFVIARGLTGIVGPNGCGKSNLVEALRWVMGETSHKSMRASAMDDVIFNGSGGRPAARTVEDDIVHGGRAHRLVRGLAHHPAQGLDEVRLAAAVRPDDPGQATRDDELRRIDESLEADDPEPVEPHSGSPPARRGGRRSQLFRSGWISSSSSRAESAPVTRRPLMKKVGVELTANFSDPRWRTAFTPS